MRPLSRNSKGIAGPAARGCAILFAIPFAGAGIFCWVAALAFCAQLAQTRGWERTSARVVQAPEPDSLNGLVYEYRWQGRAYFGKGSEAATRFVPDNGEEERLARAATAALRNQTSIPLWVNPRRPEQSFLLTPRPSLLPLFLGIFVLSHGGAGFAIIGGALLSGREDRRRAALKSRHPDEPWKWREDWARGRAEAGASWWRWLFVWAAAGWASIALPLAAVVLSAPEAGTGMRLGALGGAALSLLLGWLAREVFRRHRLARAVFVALPQKGFRSGAVHVVELTDLEASPLRIGKVPRSWTLTCRERVTTSSGGESSTQTTDRWQTQVETISYEGGKQRIRFPIAAGALDTSAWAKDEDGISWELRGKRPGEPAVGPFLLPVFGATERTGDVGSTTTSPFM